MKRLVLILFLLFAFSPFHFLEAQVGEHRSDVAIGVNGGVAMNTMSFNPTVKQSLKVGTTAGLTVRYTCEKYFNLICAFQAELNYSQAGWKEKVDTGEKGYRRTIHYFHLPLLASLGYGRERGGVKGFLVVGPQLGYCIGETAKEGARYIPTQLAGRTSQHDLNVQRKFEYGITGGLGMDISTRSGHRFIIEGRYFYALSDVFSNTKKDSFGRSANSTIFAKVAYLFDVKKTKN